MGDALQLDRADRREREAVRRGAIHDLLRDHRAFVGAYDPEEPAG
jgi:hypothetical protein